MKNTKILGLFFLGFFHGDLSEAPTCPRFQRNESDYSSSGKDKEQLSSGNSDAQPCRRNDLPSDASL